MAESGGNIKVSYKAIVNCNEDLRDPEVETNVKQLTLEMMKRNPHHVQLHSNGSDRSLTTKRWEWYYH
jgi:hypothetical protein